MWITNVGELLQLTFIFHPLQNSMTDDYLILFISTSYLSYLVLGVSMLAYKYSRGQKVIARKSGPK